ncbi:hypothetical protein FHW19_004481 [Ochrobactrum anthropi]|uniref:EexN family lipoprotein n=1 Tax=Brucella anthropi TaxID=529 RepID=UPI0015FD99F9|nr:EexN family lipoprotein [Brucella anthropi]MBA8862730.1 hypothetical protein [Brucella anthropi]
MTGNTKRRGIFFAATAAIILTGCSDESAPNYSVSDFVNDHTLMHEVEAKCRNNPGELGETPNCINVSVAVRRVKYGDLSKKYAQ